MIAEIKHKPVDRLAEDQLTGNVIGALRYLPYVDYREILLNCAEPYDVKTALSKWLPTEFSGEWGRCVEFWPRYNSRGIEPDVIMELSNTAIMIEAKYRSGESGENQLLREAELLSCNHRDSDHKFLLIVAPADKALAMYNSRREKIRKRCPDISFGYISWQRLSSVVSEFSDSSLVCSDIACLLVEKGLSGFRGFESMDKRTMAAFETVMKAHETVSLLIDRCIELATEKNEFTVVPMNRSYKFLRWNSDPDYRAWSYRSFIIAFQSNGDRRYPKSEWRNGPLYILEISFNYELYDEPTACIARYDFASVSGWTPLSVGDHDKFHDPLYFPQDYQMSYEQVGRKYCAVSDTPNDRLKGLERIIGVFIPLKCITNDNVYDKIFGQFKELKDIEDPNLWLNKNS